MSVPDLRRDGHVALITGAAGGLGLAMAEIFGAAGYRIVLVDVDADAGKEQVKRLRSREIETFFAPADVADEGQVSAAFDTALERWGRVDVVINNAGISGPEAPIQDLEVAGFERVVDVDLKGPFLVSKHAVRAMRARGGGSILNVASISADAGAPAYPAYSAAKSGVIALTRSMARHVGRFNIRVNCVSPGSIKGTGFLEAGRDGVPPSADEARQMTMALIQKIPLGRPARPEDVANAALFLASPLARHVHGSVLTVDGGESLA